MSEFAACLPPSVATFAGQLMYAASRYGVPPQLLAALVLQESAGDARAVNLADSYASFLAASERDGTLQPALQKALARGWTVAQLATSAGLAQIEGSTAVADLGFPGTYADLFVPRTNLALAARYLAKMLREFGGDQRTALAAYNAGPTAVANGTAPASSFTDYADTIIQTASSITSCWKP